MRTSLAQSTRVLVISNIYAPYRIPSLRALAERMDVTVLYCAVRGAGGMDWTLPNQFPLPVRFAGGPVLKVRGRELHVSPAILREIVRARPDVVITGGYSVPSLYAALYCRMRRRALVLFSDGTEFSERNLAPFQRFARSVLVPLADGAIAAGRAARFRFEELGLSADRVFEAPHTTDLTPFWAFAQRTIAPEEAPVRVLCVSRLLPSKGISELLAAFRIAANIEPRLELAIVGTGPSEEVLRREAAGLPNVRFRGFVDTPDMPAVFGAADVFVLPTLGDTFSIALVEAAAAGLPLLASPFAGATEELVVPGRTGFVVDPRRTHELADVLVRLAQDPQLRACMGAAAYEATRARTPEQAAEGMVSAIRRSLEPRRSRRGRRL